MPIAPKNKTRYPTEWRYIRAKILLRAGNRCESSPAYPNCRARNHQAHPVTGSTVVLTIAHLNDRPEDNRPENLRAWCQRCHLTYDARIHHENRRLGALHRPIEHPELPGLE